MNTWIVGDVLGRARELRALLERLPRGADGSAPRIVCTGNLVHGGPDPLGVVELCEAHDVRFVLGAHERVALTRLGLAPERGDGLDRRRAPRCLPLALTRELAGDRWLPCDVDEEGAERVLDFLLRHDGYVLRSAGLDAAPARDGREWCVVHGGVAPGPRPEAQAAWRLTDTPRVERRGAPRWQDCWRGAELVVHGRERVARPRRVLRDGALVAVDVAVRDGLAAYSPAQDRFVTVPAAGALAHRSAA